MAGCRVRLKRSWKFFVALAVPLVLLPILFVPDDDQVVVHKPSSQYIEDLSVQNVTETEPMEDVKEHFRKSPKFKLAYVILVMVVYWMLEILPLPITSLFPLVLFPLLGIDDAAYVSQSYMKESNTIYLGGAIVALAVEHCNLHRRVGLRLITIVGVSPRRLMFGIMAVVSILSMWISNTTCVTMIVPIIIAVVDEIHDVTDAMVTPDLVSNGGTTPQHRHSLVFANAALTSHNCSRRDSTLSSDNPINHSGSTLGRLEGHRSNQDELVDQTIDHHSYAHNSNNVEHGDLPDAKQYDTVPELSIIKIESANIPLGKRVSFSSNAPIQMDSLHVAEPDEYLSRLSVSVASITEPERIEMVMDLPSPSLSPSNEEEQRQRKDKEKWRQIKNMYLFALAYAANIGGTATITGTGPNKVFKEAIKPYSKMISQDGKYLGMTFFTWMAFNVPPMLVNIIVAWLYLTIKYCGFPKFSKTPSDKAECALRKWKEQHVRNYLLEEYKKLGKMSFHEIGVAAIFILVVLLWISRDPQLFTGWGNIGLTTGAQTGDSTSALLGAVLLFIIPKSWSFLSSKENARLEALLDWKFIQSRLPWGVLLLLGSGYAIGDSAERTGLTTWIGRELYLLHDLPNPILLLIIMLITTLITEVASNTACASVILPVLLGLSKTMEIHPLYLSVAATVTASYAFMLPVASPVNAIVFAAGDFSIWEMITNGYILNGICVLVFYINSLTLGECLFNYSEFTYPFSLVEEIET